MKPFKDLLSHFIEEASCKDPLKDLNLTDIYINPVVKEKIKITLTEFKQIEKRSTFFIPLSSENLKILFKRHIDITKDGFDFIIKNVKDKKTALSIENNPFSLSFQMYGHNKIEDSVLLDIDLSNQIENFQDLISLSENGSKYNLRYIDPFIKFFFFVHSIALQETVEFLSQEVIRLKEENKTKEVTKVPINMFNVMLTNKSNTLEKIERQIDVIEKAIKNTLDEKKLDRLRKQRTAAKNMLEKAKVNFPEDFYFPVYQHYAIFGGMKLLHQNNFKPTPFTAEGILRALNFPKINKSEITEIRKAFAELTTKKFPCYYIRQDKNDSNSYYFSDSDSPIFMIYEDGRVDLNVDISDETVVKKNLNLCLLNIALVDDLQHFFTIIDSNILAKLRERKKVSEDDLYFIEFLIREIQFQKKTKANFEKICKVMKKDDWLEETGKLTRERKRQIKDKVIELLEFSIQVGLVSKYQIIDNNDVEIEYLAIENQLSHSNSDTVLQVT